jgi:iron-sulfur cluster repair protein YtfE (RIC family)
MDPYALLKADHREVSALFAKLDETTSRAAKTRASLFEALHRALLVHMLTEDSVLYPVLKELAAARALSFEAVEEHKLVKSLLEAMAGMPVDAEEWTAKLAVLRENVEHHVREEEGELFPASLKDLTPEGQVALADRLTAEKSRIAAVLEWEPMPVFPVTDDPGLLGLR